jgi:hypothetical protein
MLLTRETQCCNHWRDSAGMACDDPTKLLCAVRELDRLQVHALHAYMPFFVSLFGVFAPDLIFEQCRLDDLFPNGGRVSRIPDAISAGAQYAAAMPTIDERRTFLMFISGYLTSDQQDEFKALLGAEWRRLRNR